MDINFEVVRAWASARTGDELALPFFEGKQIDVMVDRTRPVGEFRNVFGAVEGADGGVVLTIGPDEFAGSANLDGRTFRYEHRSGDSYSVSVKEIDVEGDAFMLRDGVDDLGQLHALRDELRADLVSLLVLNAGTGPGDDGCGKAVGRGCGTDLPSATSRDRVISSGRRPGRRRSPRTDSASRTSSPR